jgi:hypothetical protein
LSNIGGTGGVGTLSTISGTGLFYGAGGGGGGAANTASGPGGSSNSGGRGYGNNAIAGVPLVNQGGGGGGAGTNQPGTAGASGIVIISYAGTAARATGGVITLSGGFVIHTFYTSGTFTA